MIVLTGIKPFKGFNDRIFEVVMLFYKRL